MRKLSGLLSTVAGIGLFSMPAIAEANMLMEPVKQSLEAVESAKTWRNQALVLKTQQRFEQAIAAYERAIATNPQDITNWLEQGILLEQTQQFDRALISFNSALRLNPKSSLALAHRCSVLNQIGNYREALAACEAALVGDGAWDHQAAAFAWNQHSLALIGLGQYRYSLTSAQRAIALQPDYASAWNNKAVSLWFLNQLEAALDASNRATSSDATSPLAWFNQGRILSALGQYEAALSAYERVLQADKLPANTPSDILINKGVVLWYLHRYPEALEVTQQATRLNSKSFPGWYNQGVIFLRSGQYKQAVQSFNQASLIQPSSVAALTGKGIALMGMQNYQEAFSLFELVLNRDPFYPLARQKREELLGKLRAGSLTPSRGTKHSPNHPHR